MLAGYNFLKSGYATLITAVMMTSCIPPIHDAPPDLRTYSPSDANLLEIGYALPYLQDFMYSIERTYLTHLMEEEGPYTVFIPVQASFATFRMKYDISHLDQFPVSELAEILRYHFIRGRWALSSLRPGYYPTLLLEPTSGNPVVIFIENNSVFKLNGMYLLDEPDLYATNGYIHSIKSVLDIPTAQDLLSVNENFSLILELIRRDDLEPDLKSFLTNGGPFTFLAPDNNAIQSFIDNDPTWNSVDDIPVGVINSILKNHFIGGENVVMGTLKEDRSMTSAAGHDLRIEVDYKKWIIRDTNGKATYVTAKDIQAINGVIHQVDRLLIP